MATEQQSHYRAEFDAAAAFTNGGDLRVKGFRVDIPDRDVSTSQIAELFVASLGLLMTRNVELANVRILEEPHKATRGGPSDHHAERTSVASGCLVELSHVIESGMTTIPGLPTPVIEAHLTREASQASYAPGTEFEIDRITMVGNTGTYMDCPFHRYGDGEDFTAIHLDRLAHLPAIVVRTAGSGKRAVDVGSVAAFEVAGKAVLLHTGGDLHWRSPQYAVDPPYLTRAAAEWLAEHDAVLVGIDSINIDDTDDPTRPAHSVLLGAGIPVVEHLTGLDQLPPHGATFTAVPPLFATLATFPVRAFALLP